MLKGIDVSAYNGTIDWGTVAAYGMDFAILRITEKGNVVVVPLNETTRDALTIIYRLVFINTAMLSMCLKSRKKLEKFFLR